ncbi:MAG TPA: two-component regulator propeller domain-containing protein [Pyrinomonadaceae bacterium]|nr:two-component regulator propeller domain-containing protein [Pyrinomonadaceae bacterium]
MPLSFAQFLKLALLVFVCLLTTATAYSLDPSRLLTQFHHTAWTARDGAPSQISALAQTADGYLWIGSARGLFRFDGVKFERYVPPPGIELPAHNIYSLKATQDGGLWVSFRPSGVGFIKDGRIEVFTEKTQLPSSQIYCFGIDGKGRLWAGTHNGLALWQDDGGWTEIGNDWGFIPRRVRAIFTDRSGRMWVVVDNSVVMLPPTEDRFEESGAGSGVFTALGEAPDGRMWIGEFNHLIAPLVHPSNSPSGPSYTIKPSRIVGSMLFDRDGGLWFTDDDGLKRVCHPNRQTHDLVAVDDSEFEVFGATDGLSGSYANPIVEDREGNIWVGTAQGLDRFRYSYFLAHRASSEYRNITLMPDAKSGVWAGSSIKLPLAHFDGTSVRTFANAMYISSVFRDDDGVTWWGAQGRLLRQSGDSITQYAQPADLKIDWLWEIFGNDSNDLLWTSLGDDGLVGFKNGKWESRTPPSNLPDRGPSASYRENASRTWLGYTENRLALVEGGQAKLFTAEDGIDVGRIRVIRGGAGGIWVGGELGLAFFDGNRCRTIRTDSADRFGTVSGIVFSNDGSLWLNEVRGIVRISHEDVSSIVRDPNHNVSFRRFDYHDGLPGAPQMNWTVSTAVESSDGRLWFATDGGLVSIDPANLVSNPLPPPVSIGYLSSNGQSYEPNVEIELPEGTEDLSIGYTALSLSIPERVEFRYMLDGVDPDWRDAHDRREAFYTNLGPGDYHFRVIAANNDGVWNRDGAIVRFRILPRFYQTNWFLALCGVFLVAAAVVAYRLRVRQVKARLHMQFEERLAERTRIAQDLHDTLLQGFVSASMQLDVAVDNLATDSPVRPRLERVHEMVGQLIQEGRNTVKGLRTPGVDGSEGFEQPFFRLRDENDLQRSVDFRVIITGKPRSLHPVIFDEVSHIAHEALVNAFRHSKAKRIEAEVEYTSRALRLSVRDDGDGIDQNIVRSGRDGHWGLSGMRERAENIKSTLKVWSRPAAGTEIELTVPADIAYQERRQGVVRRIMGVLRRKRDLDETLREKTND